MVIDGWWTSIPRWILDLGWYLRCSCDVIVWSQVAQ
jgi:hypothetical protein